MLFWSSALLGNLIVMAIDWGVEIIELKHRIIISSVLLVVCYSSLVGVRVVCVCVVCVCV